MQNINKFTEVYIFVPSITIRRKLPYMESRVKEIDYLKCIFITLMIIFHLVYIGDKYPYAKQIVYTFHMSAFLIISGYLANNRKDARSFLRKFLWIFIPYACMEAAYTVMSHFLPVRESVDAITPTVLLDKIFLHPMGPYWYLHTLILCSLIYYITFRRKCEYPQANHKIYLIFCTSFTIKRPPRARTRSGLVRYKLSHIAFFDIADYRAFELPALGRSRQLFKVAVADNYFTVQIIVLVHQSEVVVALEIVDGADDYALALGAAVKYLAARI